MKKLLLLSTLAAAGFVGASAQAIESPALFDNLSIGVQGGVTTPLTHHPFFKSMRPVVGLTIDKQITPTFAVGVEGQGAINTSSWKGRTHSTTAFDDSYVGAYGAVDLVNLFGGYPGHVRPFGLEAVAGAGWGHTYLDKAAGKDHNYFATKAGLNFNFNPSNSITINVSPSVYFDMSDAGVAQSSAAYNANKATFNIQAGVVYHMGGTKFDVVRPYDQAEVDALNGQINDLRGALAEQMGVTAGWQANAAALASALEECQNRPAEVVEKVEIKDYLNSVRFVFFKIGSSTVTADQMPNVEMIADYLKAHPEAKVEIKGYASKDGNLDFNIQLAQRRADAVRTLLINRYKINADRITAQGEGIGDMFEVESWNRVSICTIQAEQ
ncbi:MAG: OmpA family protein [Muribaculaceae bacterium]|nr:OmpA family protein [Muribaculaceae bacterium]